MKTKKHTHRHHDQSTKIACLNNMMQVPIDKHMAATRPDFCKCAVTKGSCILLDNYRTDAFEAITCNSILQMMTRSHGNTAQSKHTRKLTEISQHSTARMQLWKARASSRGGIYQLRLKVGQMQSWWRPQGTCLLLQSPAPAGLLPLADLPAM